MKFCEQCQKEFEGEELYCNDCGIPLSHMIKLEMIDYSSGLFSKDLTTIRIKGNIMTIEKIDKLPLSTQTEPEIKTIYLNEIIDIVKNNKVRYFFLFMFLLEIFAINLVSIDIKYLDFPSSMFFLISFLMMSGCIAEHLMNGHLEIRLPEEVIVIVSDRIDLLNKLVSFFKCYRAELIDDQNKQLEGSETLICSNCGKKLLRNYHFCQFCGKNIDTRIVVCSRCGGESYDISYRRIFLSFMIAYVVNVLLCEIITVNSVEDLCTLPFIIKFVIINSIIVWGHMFKKCSKCNGHGYFYTK